MPPNGGPQSAGSIFPFTNVFFLGGYPGIFDPLPRGGPKNHYVCSAGLLCFSGMSRVLFCVCFFLFLFGGLFGVLLFLFLGRHRRFSVFSGCLGCRKLHCERGKSH